MLVAGVHGVHTQREHSRERFGIKGFYRIGEHNQIDVFTTVVSNLIDWLRLSGILISNQIATANIELSQVSSTSESGRLLQAFGGKPTTRIHSYILANSKNSKLKAQPIDLIGNFNSI